MKNLNNYINEKYSGSSKEYKKIKDLKTGDTIYFASIKNKTSKPKISELKIEIFNDYIDDFYDEPKKFNKVIATPENNDLGTDICYQQNVLYMLDNDYTGTESYIINNPWYGYVYIVFGYKSSGIDPKNRNVMRTKHWQNKRFAKYFYWNAWATTKEELEKIIRDEYDPDSQYNKLLADKQAKLNEINIEFKDVEDRRNKIFQEIENLSKKFNKS